jgi:flagella basal body P-ring formation protein FlgA
MTLRMCHAPGAAMRILLIATSLVALFALAAPSARAASGWQPVDSIRAAALSTLPAGSEGDTTLDSALRLPACGQALSAQPTGTSTVEVSCPDPGGWRLFVPVKVRRNQTVLILNRGIAAGETLGVADITTAQRDVARIAGAALADPAAAVGRVARRTLSAGSLLSANDLVAQRLVRRGDSVALVSRFGGVEVRVAGKALADAGENERVSVENLSSRKIVQGTVAASGDVFVTR